MLQYIFCKLNYDRLRYSAPEAKGISPGRTVFYGSLACFPGSWDVSERRWSTAYVSISPLSIDGATGFRRRTLAEVRV